MEDVLGRAETEEATRLDTRTPMKTFKALFVILCVFVACDQGPTSRPDPLSNTDAWDKFCAAKQNCGLCASEGNCGYCPDTNVCMRISAADQSAKAVCPALITTMEMCP